jgi:hypothetical protein
VPTLVTIGTAVLFIIIAWKVKSNDMLCCKEEYRPTGGQIDGMTGLQVDEMTDRRVYWSTC